MKRLILLLNIALLINSCIYAESKMSMWRPNWTYNTPKSTSSSYAYASIKGWGSTEAEARNNAYARAMQAAQAQLGIMVKSDEINKAVQAGEDFNVISQDFSIPMWEVCQYSNRDGTDYIYWILMRIASDANKSVSREPFEGDCYDFSKASELRAQFKGEFKEDIKYREKKQKAEKKSMDRAERHEKLTHVDFAKERYVAWRIVGAGYPWNLTSGINFRYGFYEFLGVGAYLDLGADFTHINVLSSGEYYKTTGCHFHYSGGVKFYPYRGLFVGCGFTSIAPAVQKVSVNYYVSHNSDGWVKGSDAKSIQNLVNQSNGVAFGVGYDLVTNRNNGGSGFYLGLNAGAVYDIQNKTISPTASLRIGVAWGY